MKVKIIKNLNYFFLVYFVSKGTVSFCLGKEYQDKEIKEIKKRKFY